MKKTGIMDLEMIWSKDSKPKSVILSIVFINKEKLDLHIFHKFVICHGECRTKSKSLPNTRGRMLSVFI